jgi:hypothetical protein
MRDAFSLIWLALIGLFRLRASQQILTLRHQLNVLRRKSPQRLTFTSRPARIYPWRRMHRSRAPSIAPGSFFVAQSWAGCITNMPGFNLRQAQIAHYRRWSQRARKGDALFNRARKTP